MAEMVMSDQKKTVDLVTAKRQRDAARRNAARRNAAVSAERCTDCGKHWKGHRLRCDSCAAAKAAYNRQYRRTHPKPKRRKEPMSSTEMLTRLMRFIRGYQDECWWCGGPLERNAKGHRCALCFKGGIELWINSEDERVISGCVNRLPEFDACTWG